MFGLKLTFFIISNFIFSLLFSSLSFAQIWQFSLIESPTPPKIKELSQAKNKIEVLKKELEKASLITKESSKAQIFCEITNKNQIAQLSLTAKLEQKILQQWHFPVNSTQKEWASLTQSLIKALESLKKDILSNNKIENITIKNPVTSSNPIATTKTPTKAPTLLPKTEANKNPTIEAKKPSSNPITSNPKNPVLRDLPNTQNDNQIKNSTPKPSLPPEANKNQSQTAKKFWFTFHIPLRFVGARQIVSPNVSQTFSVGMITGLHLEMLFLNLAPKFWIGAMADFYYQHGFNANVDLKTETGPKYGTASYLFSILATIGISFQYFITPKLRLGGGISGGYDATFLDVNRRGTRNQQVGDGFLIQLGVSASYEIIRLGNAFSLLVGGDFLWSLGVTSNIVQNYPAFGIHLGGSF